MSRKNDMRQVVDGLAKLEGPNGDYTGTQVPNAQRACAITLIRRTLRFSLSAITAGGTLAATASPAQEKMRFPGRVLGATLNPAGASTASDTDYQTIGLKKNNGATPLVSGSTKTTGSGGTGSLVPGTPVNLTLATLAADQRFAKGDVLAPFVAAAGAGVAIAACTLQVEVELEGPIDDFGV